MNDYNFTLADGLVFNDSVVNGTAVTHPRMWSLLEWISSSWLRLLLVINLITLAYIIMKVDLV